jgi:prevent-host-death family protein
MLYRKGELGDRVVMIKVKIRSRKSIKDPLKLTGDLFSDYIWSCREVLMKLSDQIKPISYLKAHAAEVVRNLSTQREPLVITQNGEAKAVMLDIKSYEQTQETMALLKMLALGQRQIDEGKVQPAGDVVAKLRSRNKNR